jgi:hypothetical protein
LSDKSALFRVGIALFVFSWVCIRPFRTTDKDGLAIIAYRSLYAALIRINPIGFLFYFFFACHDIVFYSRYVSVRGICQAYKFLRLY